MLFFPGKAPLNFEEFILLCERFIPEKEVEIIKNISIKGEYQYQSKTTTLKKWQDFDTSLRNELVKIRGVRKQIDYSKYLRFENSPDLNLTHTVTNIVRNPSVLEVEKGLDLERWHFLEELSFGHYFDLDFLIIYALKLLILERWGLIEHANKEEIINNIFLKFA